MPHFKSIPNPRLLTTAQRKPPAVIRAPAFVWHQALWCPALGDSLPSEIHKADARFPKGRKPNFTYASRIARRNRVDDYLIGLYRILSTAEKKGAPRGFAKFSTPNMFGSCLSLMACELENEKRVSLAGLYEDEGQKAKTSDLVVFKFSWWGINTTLRFELHTEYLTITCILDLSSKDRRDVELFETSEKDNSPDQGLPEPAPPWPEYPNVRCIKKTLEDLDRVLETSTEAEEFLTHHQTLFDGVWKTFHRDVLDLASKDINLGGVFTDFRCLVLGLPEKPEPARPFFLKPFWRQAGPDSRKQIKRNDDFWEPWRLKFWPLVTVNVGTVDFARQEFTVTRMMKGRALHVTALGTQPDDPVESGCFPLRTLYLADTLNGWQLGRLVDRMNHQGTTRLAAVMGFHKLRVAAYGMREIEQLIDRAMQRYFRSKGHGTSPELSPAETASRILNDQEETELELKGALKDIDDRIRLLNDQFDGSIEYRIARSRFYTRQFFEGLSAVRPRRLQGFQPYKAFVTRRVGGVFDFMHLMADQYARMIADRALLFRHFQAQQAHCVELRSQNANAAVVRLQKTAEYALIVGLLPYYLSMIIMHGLQIEERSMTAGMIWAGMWILGLTVAVRRYREDRIRAKRPRTLVSLARRLTERLETPLFAGVMGAIIAAGIIAFFRMWPS